MKSLKYWPVPILLGSLIGCAPVDDIDPVTDFGGTGGGTVLPVNPGGLIEREPDTCGASGYQDLVGQNQSVVATLGLTRPSRIFGQNDIVTQEYDPARINFEVSPSGQIRRISCG